MTGRLATASWTASALALVFAGSGCEQRRVDVGGYKLWTEVSGRLANVSESLGHLKEAEALLHEAVDGMRRVVGPEAPATLATMNTLGNVYSDEGRYADAATLLEQTLEAQRRTLGPEHPFTLESAFALADVYDSEGRYAEAEKLAHGVVTTYERTKLQDAESVAAARVALGRALGGLKHYPRRSSNCSTQSTCWPRRRGFHARSASRRWSRCTRSGTRPHQGQGTQCRPRHGRPRWRALSKTAAGRTTGKRWGRHNSPPPV